MLTAILAAVGPVCDGAHLTAGDGIGLFGLCLVAIMFLWVIVGRGGARRHHRD